MIVWFGSIEFKDFCPRWPTKGEVDANQNASRFMSCNLMFYMYTYTICYHIAWLNFLCDICLTNFISEGVAEVCFFHFHPNEFLVAKFRFKAPWTFLYVEVPYNLRHSIFLRCKSLSTLFWLQVWFGLIFCTILLLSWLARVLSRRLPRQDWVSPVDGSKPFAAMKPPHSHLKMLLVRLWIAAWWNFAGHLGSVRSKDMCIFFPKSNLRPWLSPKIGQVVWVGFGNILRDTSPVTAWHSFMIIGFSSQNVFNKRKRMTFKVTRFKEIQWLEKKSVRSCLSCAILMQLVWSFLGRLI